MTIKRSLYYTGERVVSIPPGINLDKTIPISEMAISQSLKDRLRRLENRCGGVTVVAEHPDNKEFWEFVEGDSNG